MIDVKLLREDPERVRREVARKKFDCDIDAVLALDERRRSAITEAEQLKARQKAANQEMAALDKKSPEFHEKIREMKQLSADVKALEAKAREADEAFGEIFLTIPNLPDPEIPEGGEDGFEVVQTWGDCAGPDAGYPPHYAIPWFERLCDFERGVKVTGAGFPFFVGDLARLVRALIQFLVDEAEAAGFPLVIPPLVVNADRKSVV